ncbi:hypothetical protein B7463_g7108, partial [Scytalidium lignicola]
MAVAAWQPSNVLTDVDRQEKRRREGAARREAMRGVTEALAAGQGKAARAKRLPLLATLLGPATEELLKRLDEQHQAYLETFRLVHESLAQTQAAPTATAPRSPSLAPTSSPPPIPPTIKRLRRETLDFDAERLSPVRSLTLQSSIITGDETSDDEDDGDLYVQTPLPPSQFDHEIHLRSHLKNFKFGEASLKLLESVIAENGRLVNPVLFPEYSKDELSHNSHYSVYDVGADGAPVDRHQPGNGSIDMLIWRAIREVNANPARETKAVGRITFEYYTCVGPECQPMPWQLADRDLTVSPHHIPISRCGAIVALSLSGAPIRKIRNPSRNAKTLHGFVHDPWAAWQVLSIQCYPDHKHTMDTHDSTKHYVNGPEAFMYTLLAEFKDAQKRYEEIYHRITKLITPSADFMFNSKLRDKLLFEDASFTYSRRYFWAYQTLGIMNQGIKSIIDSYHTSFTDDVWEGQHKSIWPMADGNSSRSMYFKKRMRNLRLEFEKEIKGLERVAAENDERRKEIRTLRDQLFSGTSVLESRKSVEMSQITVQQGHNIKLLTLVSIFFLPLTFVTSVFGMSNMPTEHQFLSFAIVMTTVCVPFFLLIGSLNTIRGMEFWRMKTLMVINWITRKPSPKSHDDEEDDEDEAEREAWGVPKPQNRIATANRTPSHSEARAIRMAQLRQPSMSRSSTVHSETPSFQLSSPPPEPPVQNSGSTGTNITIQEISNIEQQAPSNSSSEKTLNTETKRVTSFDTNKQNGIVAQDRVTTQGSITTGGARESKNRDWRWVQKMLGMRKNGAKNNDEHNV